MLQNKFLKTGSLALLQIVILGNMQILPADAIYGFSLPFFFLLAILFFYIPCVLMTAELATTHPQTGGAYIWCEKAFGAKAGFITITLLWLSNLLWYPSIFSLIAANFAYLFQPTLAVNKTFIMSFGLIAFWCVTILNCLGVKISSRISMWCSVLGIIMPMLLMIGCGIYWWLSGHTLAVTTAETPLIPDLTKLNNLGYLISIITTLFGIEMTAVHAGNVLSPRRDYPLSLLISSIVTITLLVLAAMAIAVIIPNSKLSVMTGLLDALVAFFQHSGLQTFLVPILFLVFLGNIGSLAAWMLSSTRGMFVAAQHNHVIKFMQITNKQQAPVGVLLFEAIVFTIASGIFLLFSQVTDTFWLLLDIASQITLVYYIILFASAIRLRYLPTEATGFQIPGGTPMMWCLMSLGILSSLAAIIMGFIPPDNLSAHEHTIFHTVMVLGLLTAFILPFAIIKTQRR